MRKNWYTKFGIRSDRLRPREQGKEELAHYSVGTTDIEYLFPFSDEPQELEGVAHRADYDLQQHTKHTGKDLSYFDEELWDKADKFAYGGDKKKEQEAQGHIGSCRTSSNRRPGPIASRSRSFAKPTPRTRSATQRKQEEHV